MGVEKLIKVLRDEATKKHRLTNEAAAADDGGCGEDSYCNCSYALKKMYEDNPDLLKVHGICSLTTALTYGCADADEES